MIRHHLEVVGLYCANSTYIFHAEPVGLQPHCHGWVRSPEAVTVRLDPLQQTQRRAAREQFCHKLTALGAQTPLSKRLVVEVGEPPLQRMN